MTKKSWIIAFNFFESRVKFYREYDKQVILLHKPHPGDEMKAGAVKGLLERLYEIGDL